MFSKYIYSMLVSISMCSFITHTNPLNHLYKGPWDCLEDTFIVKPRQQSNAISGLSLRWAVPTFVGFAGIWATYKTTQASNDIYSDEEPMDNRLRATLITLSGIVPTVVMYKIVNDWYSQASDLKVLTHFISQWPLNETFTPKSLHKAFGDLHTLYTNNRTEFNRFAPDAVRLIKNSIYEQFPAKYGIKPRYTLKDFFTAKYFNSDVRLDLGSTLTGVAKVIEVVKK